MHCVLLVNRDFVNWRGRYLGSRLAPQHQAKVFTDALWLWAHITGARRIPRWEVRSQVAPLSSCPANQQLIVTFVPSHVQRMVLHASQELK